MSLTYAADGSRKARLERRTKLFEGDANVESLRRTQSLNVIDAVHMAPCNETERTPGWPSMYPPRQHPSVESLITSGGLITNPLDLQSGCIPVPGEEMRG